MRLNRSQISIYLMLEVVGKLVETEMYRAERTIKQVMFTVIIASKNSELSRKLVDWLTMFMSMVGK